MLRAIADPMRSDVRELFEYDGNIRPIKSLTRRQPSMIAGFEVIIKNAEAGDGHLDVIHKVKIVDRSKFIEMAAKHFRLLTEQIQMAGG